MARCSGRGRTWRGRDTTGALRRALQASPMPPSLGSPDCTHPKAHTLRYTPESTHPEEAHARRHPRPAVARACLVCALTRIALRRYAAAVARAGPSLKLDDDAVAMGEMVVPACPAGGLLLWDFRTLHRGMPNDTLRGMIYIHDPRDESRTLLAARGSLSAPPALALRSAARRACGAVDRLGARPPRRGAGEPHCRARRAASRRGGTRRSARRDRAAAG